MLKKLLKIHRLSPSARGDHPKPANPPTPQQLEIASSVLKIVHAGGKVECYYMPIPAARILDKHPSHALAKPEVFRRPWNSVVRPEKILIPGEKFLLVPHPTVKKLRRRIKKPSKELSSSVSFISEASNSASVDRESCQKVDVSSGSLFSQCDSLGFSVSSVDAGGSFRRSALRKKNGVKKHVRFAGIDVRHKAAGSSTPEKREKLEDSSLNSSNVAQSHGGKRRPRNSVVWQPSLTMICESQID